MCHIFVQIQYITPRVNINVNCQPGWLWYIIADSSVVTNVGSSSSREWTEGKECVCSVIQLYLCDPMDVACQVSLFMGFSNQEYCRGLPFPTPRNFPDLRIKPRSPALHANSLPLGHLWSKRGNLYICLSILL